MNTTKILVNLEIEVLINDIDDHSVIDSTKQADHQTKFSFNRSNLLNSVKKEKRLLHSILNNRTILSKYIKTFIEEKYLENANVRIKEDLSSVMKSALPELDKEDQAFFNQAIENSVFPDQTSLVYNSFKDQVLKMEIKQVE